MTDCYIDPEYGDDDGTGTDASNPYRTFKNLNDGSHTLSYGNRAHLLAGKTFRDELTLQDGGDATARIIIQRYGDGDNPIILGSDRANGLHLETNLIINPSFEEWTGNVPDDWTVVEQGGTELREETSDVGHLSSVVSMKYDSDKGAGFNCSIRNTAALSLDDNRIYTLSYMHKDPAITEDDGQAYMSAVIWRTDSVGGLEGEYWVVDESGVGSWSLTYLFGNMAATRAWWYQTSIDIDTGNNPNSYNYYYVKFEAFRNPNEFDGEKRDYYELLTFLLDAVSLGPKNATAVNTNIITDSGFEEWDTSDDLTEWVETFCPGESGNYVLKNETEVLSGNYSLEMYVTDVVNGAAKLSVLVSQESLGNLGNNTTWDLKVLHKQSRILDITGSNPVDMALLLWRTGGSGKDEYLILDANNNLVWQTYTFIGFSVNRSLDWILSEYTVETGENVNGHNDYNIAVAPYQPGNGMYRAQTSDTSYYVDGIVLKKQGAAGGNKFSNPRFDDWTGSAPDDWTTFSLGSTILEQHDNRRFGDYSVRCTMDTDDSDVGVRQIVTLEGSTTYRLGMFVMCHEGSAAYTVEVAATVKRNSDGYYWDGSSWVTDEADALSVHSPEFERHSVDITTDAGEGTYTISIHRAADTFMKMREQFYIDYVSMVAKDSDTEVYKCQFGDIPKHVFFTGVLSGQTETRLQLYNETWACIDNSEKNHPHVYGYTYDRVTEMLYINMGEALPDSYTIECSVRDNNINCGEESYITIQDLTLYTTKRNNVDLGNKVAGVEPEGSQREMTVKRCDCQYAGESAVVGGYVQPTPYDGATSVLDESYQFPNFAQTPVPPMNVCVNDNTLSYFARNKKMRVETAEDQLLDDPDVEDWDTTDDLADWTEVEAKAGDTVSQESTDVREGSYAVKCVTGADAAAFAGIKQEGMTDVFTTDVPSRTIVVYYKCSSLDAQCAIILGRADSSGAGGGDWEFLEEDGEFHDDNIGIGFALPASTEWARYEITFSEGANPDDLNYYKFLVGPYVDGTQSSKTFHFDRLSFHGSLKSWWTGYGPKECGFLLQPGPYKYLNPVSEGIGLSQRVHVRNNSIECDIGYENWNTGRAGITIKNGGLTGGDPVVIDGNTITNVDHGISVFGGYATVPGNVGHVNIIYNEIYHTGDDNCWVEGMGPSGATSLQQNVTRIMYNIFDGSRDNGLEIAQSILVEVYGNLFNNHGNESLALYTHWAIDAPTCAYIYNNIFYNWGEDWVTGNPGILRGCAIGSMTSSSGAGVVGKGQSFSDYNFFYATHDPTATKHPFEMTTATGKAEQKTFAEWQAYGFDAHSTIINPVFVDIANNDYRVRRGSPCIDAGHDLSTVTDAMKTPFTYAFLADIVIDDALDTRTSWPDNVMTMEQGEGAWNVGPWADPVATITRGDGDPEFPTDKSLYGIAVYVVDTVNYRIWKGVITSNTADELSLDDWEPVFNADGLYPEGTYPYYIGYIYLYDKTPEFSFVNSHWEKGLREYEFLTNDIETANLAFFRQTLNGGETSFVDDGSFEGSRLSVKVIKGLHRILQQEHAMLTKQKIHIKEITYHVDWKRGKMDQ